MPCLDDGRDEYENRLLYGLSESSADIATRVACEAVEILDRAGLLSAGSELLRKWAQQHRKDDLLRKGEI